MVLQKETKWLCENAKALEQYSGKWITFSARDGVLSRGSSLETVLRSTKRVKVSSQPFVFRVPAKDQMGIYVPVIEDVESRRPRRPAESPVLGRKNAGRTPSA